MTDQTTTYLGICVYCPDDATTTRQVTAAFCAVHAPAPAPLVSSPSAPPKERKVARFGACDHKYYSCEEVGCSGPEYEAPSAPNLLTRVMIAEAEAASEADEEIHPAAIPLANVIRRAFGVEPIPAPSAPPTPSEGATTGYVQRADDPQPHARGVLTTTPVPEQGWCNAAPATAPSEGVEGLDVEIPHCHGTTLKYRHERHGWTVSGRDGYIGSLKYQVRDPVWTGLAFSEVLAFVATLRSRVREVEEEREDAKARIASWQQTWLSERARTEQAEATVARLTEARAAGEREVAAILDAFDRWEMNGSTDNRMRLGRVIAAARRPTETGGEDD